MIYLGVLLLAVAAFGGCVAVNRFYQPPALEQARITGTPSRASVPAELVLTTWNIGYAGMGQDSDFLFDLGQQRRPLAAGLVDENLAAILTELQDFDSDLLLLQEAARPSWISYQRDVLAAVTEALPGYAWTFGADLKTRQVPPPLRVELGNASLSRLPIARAERRGLPLEPSFELGVFRKGYRMHILRLAPSWVVVNVHLSTFDSAEDDVRRAQVAAVLRFAQAEYAAGRHVVIGGDWNLRLADTAFAHRTDPKYLFWIRDMPQELIPQGWTWAVDPATPTVRTAHQPYVAGDNYTLVIDGFLVSPNVAVLDTRTRDLGFRHTDHHPVTTRLRAR